MAEGYDQQDDTIPPELMRCLDFSKLLEAEMDEVQREFHDEEERWQRQIEDAKANIDTPGGQRSVSSSSSSIQEDANVAERALVSMKEQMEVEEKQMLQFLDQQSAEGVPKQHADEEAKATKKKNDVRNLASLFEQKLAPTNLPKPPPKTLSKPPPTSVPFDKPKASGDDTNHQRQKDASLSIREGKALFERSFCSNVLQSQPARKNEEETAQGRPVSKLAPKVLLDNSRQQTNQKREVFEQSLAKSRKSTNDQPNSMEFPLSTTCRVTPSTKESSNMKESNSISNPSSPLFPHLGFETNGTPASLEAVLGGNEHQNVSRSLLDETVGKMDSDDSDASNVPPPKDKASTMEKENVQGSVVSNKSSKSLDETVGNLPPSPKTKPSFSTSKSLPLPTVKVAVSPSMPFTPIRPNRTLALSHSTGSISDDAVNQRRAALMQGLKNHLKNKKKSHDEAEVVTSFADVAHGTTCSAGFLSPVQAIRKSETFVRSEEGCRQLFQERYGTTPMHTDLKLAGKTVQKRVDSSQNSGVGKLLVPSPSHGDTASTTEVEDTVEEGLLGESILLQSSLSVSNSFESDTPCQQGSIPRTMHLLCIHLQKSTSKCAASSIDMLRSCFALVVDNMGTCFVCCRANISSNLNIVRSSVLHRYREVLDYQRLLLSLAPSAIKTVASWSANMERGIAMCFASLVISVYTDVYPTSPRCNCFISLLLLFFQVSNPSRASTGFNGPLTWQDKSKHHSIFLIVATVVSVAINVDFLTYKYFPASLDKDDLAYRIHQDSSLSWSITWYGILTGILLQALCLNESLKMSRHGRKIMQNFWQCVSKFLVSNRIPEDLSAAVRDKVVALAWIEIISSISYFVYFFFIEFDNDSILFLGGVPNQVLSLKGSLLLKATSGFFVFLSLVHHVRAREFVGLFACKSICPLPSDTQQMRRSRILSRLEQSIKCVLLAKIVDFALGVIVWIGVVSTHRQTGLDAPKDIVLILGMIFCVQMLTCIVSPVLIVVVAWYLRQSKQNMGSIIRRQAMEQNTPVSGRGASHKHRRFVPRTTKRSSSNSGTTGVASRNPPRLRLDLLDNELTPTSMKQSDYDLNNPVSTQALFETRITGASTGQPSPSPTMKSNELDLSVTSNHRQFRSEWKSLRTGLNMSHRIHQMPTLSDCHKHFHARRFYVVGSGVVGDESRLFAIAQRRLDIPSDNGRPPLPRNALSRCLVEVTFRSKVYEMKAEVRCRKEDDIRFFLNALDLRELFG